MVVVSGCTCSFTAAAVTPAVAAPGFWSRNRAGTAVDLRCCIVVFETRAAPLV